MSGFVLFLVGATVGGVVGWLTAGRVAPARRPSMIAPPLPEELIGSDTASHEASALKGEITFDPLASLLLERCVARVALPCALVMRERLGAAAHIVSTAGGLDARLMGIEVPLDSPAGRAITEGLPVVGAPDEKVLSIDRRDRRRYSGGGVAVPVAQGAIVHGAVLAFGEPPAGTQDCLDGLAQEVRRFAPLVVTAYTAANAARRAETDELTGLANRRAFNRFLTRDSAGERAALVLFDIDHFKDVNDSLGHPAGDAALRHVSRLVRQALRPRDTAARIGGEEFAVWLPGADLAQGQEVAERLRASLANTPFKYSGNERTITISLGVAAYPVPTKAVENLMGNADVAMYQAKRAGRNRVVASQAAAS